MSHQVNKKPHGSRSWLLLLTASLGLAAAAAPGLASDTASANGLSVGTSVPRFMLPVVNSDAFTESKRWGPNKWVGEAPEKKKLVIMSFFATYCEPCKKEMPELVRLYGAYKDQGLGVMLVSIDKGMDKRAELGELAKTNGVPFPVLHDAFQVVARRYKAEKLPYMLMVGPDGVIKTVHVGYTEELKATLENEVRGHLGLAAAAAPTAAATDAKKPEPKAEAANPEATAAAVGEAEGADAAAAAVDDECKDPKKKKSKKCKKKSKRSKKKKAKEG